MKKNNNFFLTWYIYLPDSNNGICYEDKKDNKRLHKGCNGFFPLLKPGQYLNMEQRKKLEIIT